MLELSSPEQNHVVFSGGGQEAAPPLPLPTLPPEAGDNPHFLLHYAVTDRQFTILYFRLLVSQNSTSG